MWIWCFLIKQEVDVWDNKVSSFECFFLSEMEANRQKYAADISSIKEAHERIKPYIHKTPVLTSESLNSISGKSLFFKCECFQRG